VTDLHAVRTANTAGNIQRDNEKLVTVQCSSVGLLRVGHKKWHFTFVHIFAIIDRFSQFFYWHTLQTIGNNVIITYYIVNASLHYFVKYQ